MSSPGSKVLRFQRSDEPQAFVLVQVSPIGPAPLDLTLTATEGESPYVSLVKQSRLKDLRAKNYQGSEDEWTNIMTFVLGQSAPTDGLDSAGLEVVANISGSDQENKELIITIRKRVQSITQRLGALTLKQDDEQSVELFDWAGNSTARADELEQQVTKLTNRYRLAEETIQKLSQQLEELMDAKNQHEGQLVTNFVQILNEKKLKVRNQQRLLAAATVDSAKVAEIQADIPAESPEVTGKTQVKRSAGSMSDTNNYSDGFDQMDIDRTEADEAPINDQDTEDEGHSTQPSEEHNNSSTNDDSSQDEPSQPKRVVTAKGTEPPPRVLPFTRRAGGTTKSTVPIATEQDPKESSAGETDDDEL